MASQIGVNVYAIDGIPQPTLSGLQISLPTKEVFIQEYEAQNNSNVHALITAYPNPNSQSKTQEFQVAETVSALEDLANTSGNSMFGADIYSINQNPLKNGAKRFLFPNDKPSIWPHEDGDIHSLVTFKGNDYYAHETKTELEDAANEGGGGGSGYLVAEVTLTDEQIKTLDEAGVIVVPAPGAGKIISVIQWQLVMDFSGGAYSGTGVGTNALQLYVEGSSSTVSQTITIAANSTTPEYLSRTVSAAVSQFFLSAIENKAIEVWSNLSNNLTGGNAANTLKVRVVYTEVDV